MPERETSRVTDALLQGFRSKRNKWFAVGRDETCCHNFRLFAIQEKRLPAESPVPALKSIKSTDHLGN